MFHNDKTTDFIAYCKYNNWKSVKKLIEKQKEDNTITFNIQRGFRVACTHKNYEVIDELIKGYPLNYLLNGGYFIEYMIKKITTDEDISILEYILDLGELIFTPDMHSFIIIPYLNKRFDLIDIFLDKSDVTPIFDGMLHEDSKNYCIRKLRVKKINKIIYGAK